LVDSECTYIRINKELVKKEKIRTKQIDRSFKVFNGDETKNEEVTRFKPLEVEINEHKKHIDTTVIDLNNTEIFLGYDWLVKHNIEVNWNTRTI